MIKTFFSESFGCRVNEAEREALNRQLLNSGFQYSSTNPQIYIINTCAVTEKAEREARQKVFQIKRKYPSSKIVITGCAATYWQKNQLYKNLPVDLIVDNLNKEFLVKIIKNRLLRQPAYDLAGRREILATIQNHNIFEKFLSSKRVLVKIQDGCQRFCAFCIVPYLRGLPKSIKIKELVTNIKNYQDWAKEVILTAINTEAYGYDTGENFIDLIKSIVDKTKIPRISFGSIHPWTITNEFFELYKKILPKERLVNFFHIPLQSGNDKILRLMKRGYSKKEMLEKIVTFKQLNPLALIGTDIIVGFLEEEEADFEETYNFLHQAPIDKFHIFRFSKRKNTAAFYLAKKLKEPSAQIKKKRAKILFDLGVKKYHKFLQQHINKTFSCLFLDKKINGFHRGLLSNQVPVLVKETKNFPGEIKNVKIIEFKNGELFGKII